MKRIICALLCLIFAFFLVGCSNQRYDGVFTLVESGSNYAILRYNETGVLYLYFKDTETTRGGITVLLNPDGTPMVMEETNDLHK